MTLSPTKRRLFWALMLLLVVISFVFVITPAVLIYPFRTQTNRTLEISYLFRNWSPWFTAAALLATVLLAIVLWGNARRWWRKAILVILTLLAFPPAWLARQNHFEWMFNPLPNGSYTRIAENTFVEDNDMVLAINAGNEAVAYPVRLLAYHHLVADIVGGVPLVATY